MSVHHFKLWVRLFRAPDVPDCWLGHCIEWDVISQGRTLEEAFRMTSEALTIVAEADIKQGFDPFDRTTAPKEDRDRLEFIFTHGKKTSQSLEELEHLVSEVVTECHLRVVVDDSKVPDAPKSAPEVGYTWAAAS